MQKNSPDFSMQEALRLYQSPAGQQLLALLRDSDANTLNTAANQASSGNLEQAMQTLSSLLASPEAKDLMRQLGGK